MVEPARRIRHSHGVPLHFIPCRNRATAPSLIVLAMAAIVAGCVPQQTPPPQPAPPRATPLPRPAAPALAPDWQDWPLTPGVWRYERDARGSRALYGTPGADARAVLRCDLGTRALYLSRAGATAGNATIRTSSQTRTVTMQPTGGTPPYVALSLAAGDTLLDAMAFSRGRFVIEQPGTAPLVLPPWAEIGRVIEDCRGPATGA